MFGIIITSHGKLCVEIKKTVEMFSGKIKNCYTIPLNEGESPYEYEKRLKKAIENLRDCDNILIFTDLLSGTPYNVCLKQMFLNNNIKVFTGMNVPMILSVAMSDKEEDISQIMSDAIKYSHEGIDVKER